MLQPLEVWLTPFAVRANGGHLHRRRVHLCERLRVSLPPGGVGAVEVLRENVSTRRPQHGDVECAGAIHGAEAAFAIRVVVRSQIASLYPGIRRASAISDEPAAFGMCSTANSWPSARNASADAPGGRGITAIMLSNRRSILLLLLFRFSLLLARSFLRRLYRRLAAAYLGILLRACVPECPRAEPTQLSQLISTPFS